MLLVLKKTTGRREGSCVRREAILLVPRCRRASALTTSKCLRGQSRSLAALCPWVLTAVSSSMPATSARIPVAANRIQLRKEVLYAHLVARFPYVSLPPPKTSSVARALHLRTKVPSVRFPHLFLRVLQRYLLGKRDPVATRPVWRTKSLPPSARETCP